MTDQSNPFLAFEEMYQEELRQSKLRLPSACCLSTIGLDGYPNARFVALKEMKDNIFIVCGSLDSRKGIEIRQDPKVALTFWWTVTEKQIRIQGDATQISKIEADRYFYEREREAQIVSTISKQGDEIENIEELNNKYIQEELRLKNNDIKRPENWGGFAISPLRIEFLEFNTNRFHKRTAFQKQDDTWIVKLLQP